MDLEFCTFFQPQSQGLDLHADNLIHSGNSFHFENDLVADLAG